MEKLKIKEDSLGPVEQLAPNYVVVKSDRIFKHKLARFYYTTYDVRRSEDVINPRTSHCDVMLLADPEPNDTSSIDAADTHPFLYGRVIGIYHANVVYVGPGAKNYEPMRFDFLHVRWFQLDIVDLTSNHSSEWEFLRLNRLSFPTMTEKYSFGFVDPSVILRGCHLIPAFCMGKRHPDGIGFSAMSKDAKDWRGYYVNRYDTFHWLLSCC